MSDDDTPQDAHMHKSLPRAVREQIARTIAADRLATYGFDYEDFFGFVCATTMAQVADGYAVGVTAEPFPVDFETDIPLADRLTALCGAVLAFRRLTRTPPPVPNHACGLLVMADAWALSGEAVTEYMNDETMTEAKQHPAAFETLTVTFVDFSGNVTMHMVRKNDPDKPRTRSGKGHTSFETETVSLEMAELAADNGATFEGKLLQPLLVLALEMGDQ